MVKSSPDAKWNNTFFIGNGERSGLCLGRQGTSWVFRVDTIFNPRGAEHATTAWGGSRGGEPANNAWTHVAAVYDGREIRVYVDGHRHDSRQVEGQHKPGDSPFVLGAWPRGGNKGDMGEPFKGLVRAVRISKLALYNDDFVPPPLSNAPATVAVFTFTEGHGDRLKDAGGRKIFGDIHGAQWVKLGERN